ncbi:hypothetical protein BVRB_3g057000 [Beta vulgaris subsp. vulgaris]|nr:hypothetical protein BVRB_3g057000 [Beta vulgaris subsp. vulgaris]
MILTTSCIIAFLLKPFLSQNSTFILPPKAHGVPIISTLLWLQKTTIEARNTLQKLHLKLGPIITIPIISHPFIFISTSSLAHQALIQNGALFSNRPIALSTSKILTSNQHNISSASYGPIWRLLRRNLTHIMHPSRPNSFAHARKWVLDILLTSIKSSAASNPLANIEVNDHFRFAMFSLLVFMCFGEKLEESKIREIEAIQYELLTSFSRFQILNFFPLITRMLLPNRWTELYELKKKREEVLDPLIKARKLVLQQDHDRNVAAYVDSLFTLQLSDNTGTKRNLSEEELVTICSEFLNAGTDTTSTALQWIMANLVKYPNIQDKLVQEIKQVVGEEAEEVKENELCKIKYLKAIVLEGLRRHPPSYFNLPHAVTKEVNLGGYTVPENAVVFFTVAEMGWDPVVWENPMEFKPERFLCGDEEFDISGSREIKMMPFGAGRRICPAVRMAILHLEYYVANLVWNFEWGVVDGYEVDLSEKQEFTVVMKHPLQTRISRRTKIKQHLQDSIVY